MWIVKWLLDIGTLRPKEVRDTAILNAYAIRHLRYSSLYRPRHRERLPWRQPIWLIRFKITYSKTSRWIWKTARRIRRLLFMGQAVLTMVFWSKWSWSASSTGHVRMTRIYADETCTPTWGGYHVRFLHEAKHSSVRIWHTYRGTWTRRTRPPTRQWKQRIPFSSSFAVLPVT